MRTQERLEFAGLTKGEVKKFFISLPIIVLFVAGIAHILTPVLAYLETRLMPVAVNYQLHIEEAHHDGVVIRGEFDKVRSCDLIEIQWWLEEDGAQVRVETDRLDHKAFPRGHHNGSYHRIEMTEEQILNKAHGVSLHRCYSWLPNWVTTTRFYN